MTENIQYILKDGVSAGLMTIRDKTVLLDKATQALRQEYQDLERELGRLTREQRAWEKALESTGKKSGKATDAYEKFLDTAAGEGAGEAAERLRELQRELEETQRAMRETREEQEKLNEEGRSGPTSAGGETGGFQSGGKWAFLEKLGRAGVFAPFGTALGEAATAGLTSVLGERTGAIASGVLSGAASGAAMGAAAGPLGILAGAGIGAVSGWLSGETKKREADDAAFKEYYAGLYDSVRQATTAAIQAGSARAAGREAEEAAARAEAMRQAGAAETEIQAALAGTYQAMADDLAARKADVEAGYGTGYDETRKAGIRLEQDAYDGDLGSALEALNTITGSNQAYLDNLAEQYTREALSAVLLGEETSVYDQGTAERLAGMGERFAQLQAAYDSGETPREDREQIGLEMQSLKEQAEAVAKAAYESSDQYQLVVQTEQDQIAAIRENTAALDGWRNKRALEEERSKGLGATGEGLLGLIGMDHENDGNKDAGQAAMYAANVNAFGLKYVPYDGYPAVLHQGERVLTAAESRELGAGGGVRVTVTGNSFQVRSEGDIDAIAARIADEIESRGLTNGG